MELREPGLVFWTAADWAWIMGLGKKLPQMPVLEAEAGSFRGDRAAVAGSGPGPVRGSRQ